MAGPSDDDERDTFIVLGSGRPLDVNELSINSAIGMVLDPEQLATLRRRSQGLVLTDDYAPVDNLLAPVIRLASRR